MTVDGDGDPTRRRRRDDSDGAISNANNKKDPRLGALVIPWALIALMSVAAAIVVCFPGTDSNDSDVMLLEETSSMQSNDTFMDRLLSSISSVEHVHKHVYEEQHAPLLPLTTSDRIGFVCAVLGLMVAAGGGIGGGGILVPIYILVMGFSPKHAIPLSNITVFGGAIANMLLNYPKRHPLADRPLVDWDLILVMEPLTIAGALLGVFLNKVLPELFLTIMLVVLLSVTAYTTLKKAIKMYKAETRKMRELGFKLDGTKESELTKIDTQEKAEHQNHAGAELLKDMELQEGESPGDGDLESVQVEDRLAAELKQILEEERAAPPMNISILVCLFVVVLTINLVKGGGALPSPIGIECGSGAFWTANAIMLGWILIICAYVRAYLIMRFESKGRVGYEYVEGDIQWDSRATIVYPCVCCLAGFFAGMFGVGKCCSSLCMQRYQCCYANCPFVSAACRWRYRERPLDAGHGSAPRCCICILCMHDSVYEFHCNHLFRCIWTDGYGICSCLLWCRFCFHLLWPNWIVDSDEACSTKLLHRLLDRWCGPTKCVSDDNPIFVEHGRRRTSHLWRYLRERLMMQKNESVDFFQLRHAPSKWVASCLPSFSHDDECVQLS
jgi:uncharacterized membrane protein YfcA